MANNLRHDVMGAARVVTRSARQLVYNIQGFHAQQKKGGKTYGAKYIAKFCAEHVRVSTGQEHMAKPGTIDTCLKLYNRLFNIPECDILPQESISIYGADGPWSSSWSPQEVISRFGTKPKMIGVMSRIHDWLRQGKIDARDATSTTMKSGAKSLTDVALTQFALQSHRLGPWLDGKTVLPQIKEYARDIFSSHTAYCAKYNPFEGVVDVTFMFAWPKSGTMILGCLERCLCQSTGGKGCLDAPGWLHGQYACVCAWAVLFFMPAPSPSRCFRTRPRGLPRGDFGRGMPQPIDAALVSTSVCQAVKNKTSCEELLAWRPWTTRNADVNAEIARSTHAPTLRPTAAAVIPLAARRLSLMPRRTLVLLPGLRRHRRPSV